MEDLVKSKPPITHWRYHAISWIAAISVGLLAIMLYMWVFQTVVEWFAES